MMCTKRVRVICMFADTVRANGKFSTNLYNASEYDKLALSLISPLPNEQDFAINVCALLSGTNNEGKNTTLKLCNHPRLLHYLLAHAAVYNHSEYYIVFISP